MFMMIVYNIVMLSFFALGVVYMINPVVKDEKELNLAMNNQSVGVGFMAIGVMIMIALMFKY